MDEPRLAIIFPDKTYVVWRVNRHPIGDESSGLVQRLFLSLISAWTSAIGVEKSSD